MIIKTNNLIKYQDQEHVTTFINFIDSINSPFAKGGKNTLSKHKNVSGVQFCKSADRFNYPINKAPGPGSYSASQVSMSGTGKYFYSKIHNSRARKFNLANRQTLSAKSISIFYLIFSSWSRKL